MTDKVAALQALTPSAQWVLRGDELEWLDTVQTQPTDSAIAAKIVELQAAHDALAYARAREAAYPSIQDCIHALLDGGATLTDLQALRTAVKAANPKGQVMTTTIRGSDNFDSGTPVTAALQKELKSGRKNLIINGDFQVTQRGAYTSATTLTSTSVYYLDRFKSKCDGVTGTLTHKVDQTVNGKITDTVLLSSTSTATGRLETLQMIEDLQQFKGQVTTFSAWVKSNNGNARVIMHTDGSNVQTSSNSHTGGGAWELLKGTVTNATNITNMNLYCGIQAAGTGNIAGVASGDYFEIAFLQTELGSTATDFEHRSYGEELALCQRYFALAGLILATSTPARYHNNINLPVDMRANPTIVTTVDSGSGGSIYGTWGGPSSGDVSKRSFYQSANHSAISNSFSTFSAEL